MHTITTVLKLQADKLTVGFLAMNSCGFVWPFLSVFFIFLLNFRHDVIHRGSYILVLVVAWLTHTLINFCRFRDVAASILKHLLKHKLKYSRNQEVESHLN